MDLHKMTWSQLSREIERGELTCLEVTRFFLSRLERFNSQLNAVITVNPTAEDRARELDQQPQFKGRIKGLPLGVKDMFCTQGLRTTAASRMLENYVPPYTSTAVARLESEGAVTLAKLNQDEFAMGSSNETSHFGLCRNPWNLDMVPGGSSGGSSAATAAGMVFASLGTDTGGSIRQPASFCNLVGVKPTYGRVSRYGIVAFASSLDQAGPMTRTIDDAALLTEIMSGHDRFDATTSQRITPNWQQIMTHDIRGVRVGWPVDLNTKGLHPDLCSTADKTRLALQEAGAQIVEVKLAHLEHMVPVYYMICTSEASSNLARYDGVRYGYRADFADRPPESVDEFFAANRGGGLGREIKRRIIMGTFALSSGYYDAFFQKANQVRRLIEQEHQRVFANIDCLVMPVTTSPAFPIGERVKDTLAMYLNDIFTTAANLTGRPAVSVPCGFSQDHLPIGMQIVGRHFDEQTLFNVGRSLELSFKCFERCPNGFN